MQEAEQRAPELVSLLRGCASPDASIRVPSEQKLRSLETENWFILCLVRVASSDSQIDEQVHVRVSAAILLKGAIGRCWKIKSEMPKDSIRRFLLDGCRKEPRRRVAVHMHLALASIARCDWPASWPECVQELISQLGDDNSLLVRRRTLQTLLALLRELRGRRLPAQKRQVQQLARDLFAGIHGIWSIQCNSLRGLEMSILKSLPQSQQLEALERAEIILLCTKILAVLLAVGWTQDDFNEGPFPMRYLNEMCEAQEALLQLANDSASWPWASAAEAQLSASAHPDVLPFRPALIKSARWMMRSIVESQSTKSVAFVKYLGGFLERSFQNTIRFVSARPNLVNGVSGGALYDEKLALLNVTFISNVLDCSEYKEGKATAIKFSSGAPGTDKLITAQGDVRLGAGETHQLRIVDDMINDFFKGERLSVLVFSLVSNAIALCQDELNAWVENPEEFAMNEEELTPTAAFRPACENLLTTLVDRYEETAAPMLVQLLSESEARVKNAPTLLSDSGGEGQVSPKAAARESTLLAVGLCAYWLHNRLPFRDFLEQSLFPILSNTTVASFEHQVLRRRALWVLGCITSEIDVDLQVPLYDYLLGLVESKSTEMLVRITAAKTLAGLLESYSFCGESFAPFQTRVVDSLLTLSAECETGNARMAFMKALITVVDRVQGRIVQSIGNLLRPIHFLWERSPEPEWSLWKMLTLQLMERTVDAIGEAADMDPAVKATQASELAKLLLPLVSFCTDASSPDFVYLCEPATKLWAAIATSTVTYESQMHALFPRLLDILRGDENELLPYTMDIVEAHLLFAAERILQDYGQSVLLPFFQRIVFSSTSNPANHIGRLHNVSARDEARVLRVMELLLKSRLPTVPMVLSELLSQIATRCCAPLPVVNDQSRELHISYLSLLARAVVEFGSPSVSAAIFPPESAKQGMLALIDAWIKNFGSIPSTPLGIWRRKLWVMALCRELPGTLASDGALLQSRLAVVLELWQDVHADLCTKEQNKAAMQKLLGAQPELETAPPEFANFYCRKRQLFLSDVVFAEDLPSTLRESLKHCEANSQQGLLNALLQADPALVALTSQLANSS